MSKIEDTVRIPPSRFEEPLNEVAIEIINESYVGKIDKKMGLMVTVKDIEEIGVGKVIMGDGAAYHEVVFNALFFKPELHEIVEGEVIEVTEFGAFIRIGPMDGLVHVSQVTDDYINYDGKRGALIGKESKKSLEEGNKVRARIVALSLKGKSSKETKIGLTMRQPNLGRVEWIEAEKEKRTKKGKSKKEKK
ncbi:DNA-directed RNA polymerase [Methanobacterium formicicum]|uniref:DNA-directed RNA polymerase n=1 Tax=Methanobacterium formicicum TaxID=2162 RepID=UPI00178C4C2B|nr:DNA-directed RNA polymerase [Methanobacterium formicicum]